MEKIHRPQSQAPHARIDGHDFGGDDSRYLFVGIPESRAANLTRIRSHFILLKLFLLSYHQRILGESCE